MFDWLGYCRVCALIKSKGFCSQENNNCLLGQLLVNAGDGVGFFMHPNPSAAGLTGATNVLKPDGRWVYKVSGTKAKNPECEDVGT